VRRRQYARERPDAERKDINKKAREFTFNYLEKKNVKFIPSETNFFMMQVKGMTGQEVNDAVAKYKVYIGAHMACMARKSACYRRYDGGDG